MIKLSDELYIPPMGQVIRDREKAERDKHRKATAMRREYAAARITRINNGWITYTTTGNYEARISLTQLQARSRQMVRDVSHFKKFQSMCVTNVVGRQGLRLQCKAYKPDGKTMNRKLNKYIEAKFWAWGMPETASASGRVSWIGLQELLMRTLPRDGEALFQRVTRPDGSMAIKQIDVAYLDAHLNRELPGGNRIIMSVEVDENYKPLAYWLTTPASDMTVAPGLNRRRREPVRVSADQMIHVYIPSDDESQVRGIPWGHAAMLDAKNLYGYKEGTIISCRAEANQMGFIEQDASDEIEFQGEDDEETGYKKDIEINNEPGQWKLLEPGMKANIPGLTRPSQNHEAFYKSMLRDEAAGLGVTYFSLLGDYAEVNLSSGRLGLNEERDMWRRLHGFVGEMFARRVYHWWLESALLTGEIKLTSPAQYVECQNPTWRGRGWDYMDPQKEINANVTALENKLTTYTDLYAEKGLDLVDVLETMQEEKELFAEFGIEYGPVGLNPQAAQPEPDDDDEGDGKKAKGGGESERARDLEGEMFPSSPHTNGNAAHVE